MMKEEKDIFDILFALPILKLFEPLYKKYKEIFLYLFWGGIAFFLNLFLFIAIDHFTALHELINNIICWIICVLFQFYTNRKWVFKGKGQTSGKLMRQMLSFFEGRILTLVIEEVILWVFITCLGFQKAVIKLTAQIIVIVLNYIISKWFVFKN